MTRLILHRPHNVIEKLLKQEGEGFIAHKSPKRSPTWSIPSDTLPYIGHEGGGAGG